jgi:hypothetical protein
VMIDLEGRGMFPKQLIFDSTQDAHLVGTDCVDE